jgi:hypothetical protein
VTIDGGGFAGLGEPAVVTVLTVDDIEYSILADPTMAALKAIREIRHAGAAKEHLGLTLVAVARHQKVRGRKSQKPDRIGRRPGSL